MSLDDDIGEANARITALSAAVAGLNENIDEVLSRRTEVSKLAGEVGVLETYGKRNRHLIRWLAISVLLDVCLSVGLGVVAVGATNASNKAARATSTARVTANNAHQTCLANNEARAGNLQLWTRLFLVPTTGTQTAAQQKTRADLKAYIENLYAPRNCNKVAPLPSS